MVGEGDLNGGDFRNLEVDYPVPVWLHNYSRFLASSRDVLHRFAVPALGLKVDSIPGRLNQQFLFPTQVGVFYGQCSEICGANHSFMPISIEVGVPTA